jgi:Flp pilus assembly protein TadG
MMYRRLSANFARRFWSDRDGVILPYVAIMLGVIIGLSALALDGGRLMSVQTQMQNGADALALAGAAELDRRPDSIIRAKAAIQDLIKNPISGLDIGQIAEASGIDFLQSLPASDDLPITTANLTDDPTLAAYVQVTLQPIAMQMIFPVSAGRATMNVGAQSVAGYDQIVCNAQPVFVCNPFENSGMTHFQATQALIEADQDAAYHPLIRLALSKSKNGGYTGGDTGYLIPATGGLPTNACGPGGEYGIPQALASTTLQACFRLSGINLVPGDNQPAADGLNTRFDIFAHEFSSCHVYPPDQNVRKGFITLGNINWCNAIPIPPNWPLSNPVGSPLPVDSNMIADQSFNPTVSLGNGTWNCATYWSIEHAIGPGKDSPPAGCTTTATISRYSVYQYELNFLNDRGTGSEFGRPQCNPPGAANRRVITVPIVNCGSSPVPVLNNAERVPVAAFGRFFLTLPAETATSGNPYAEFLGLVKRTDPSSTDMVQLNR